MKNAWRNAAGLASLIAGYGVTAILPDRFDHSLTKGLSRLIVRLRPGAAKRLAAAMERWLGFTAPGQTWLGLVDEYYQMKVENAWGRIRGLRRGKWTPKIRVEGLEALRSALLQKRGAVLWRMQFCASSIVLAGLWSEGIRVVHLSRVNHGAMSQTWLALRLLAPIHRRAEDWFLAERVIIPLNGSLGYMKALMQHLTNNATLSIFGEIKGRHGVTTDFFHRRAEYATGAPSLAWKAGAGLFPVYVVREDHYSYRIVIDEAIIVDQSLARREFVRRAIGEFSSRLENAVRAHPSNWLGWGGLERWP